MENTENFKKDCEKLKNIRKTYNMTQTEFAKELGVQQTIIAMIEKYKRGVTSKIKYKLLKVFDIDFDSDMNIITGEDISKLPTLSSKYKISVGIPYYSARVAAGGGCDTVDFPESKILYFDKRWLENVLNVQPENLSLVMAEGDSMLPSIQDGDLLMVDSSNLNIINNKVYVIRQDNKLRVKRLKKEITGEIRIISDNDKYPIETIDTETEIIGQVVWNGSKSII